MRNQQRGFITASAIVATFGVVALIYFSFAMSVYAKKVGEQDDNQREWLAETQHKLDAWYERNKAAIDANTDPIPVNVILSQSGVVLEHGAKIESTPRLIAAGIGFHNIVIWIPHDGASGTGLNPLTGEFNPGLLADGVTLAPTKFALTNGRAIETRAYLSTVTKMRANASRFEGYYQAKLSLDPDADATIDYFRAADCASPKNGELPCIDTHTDIGPGNVQTLLGLSSDDIVNAWGGAVQISNLEDLPTGGHTISLKTATPWGQDIQIIAVRP